MRSMCTFGLEIIIFSTSIEGESRKIREAHEDFFLSMSSIILSGARSTYRDVVITAPNICSLHGTWNQGLLCDVALLCVLLVFYCIFRFHFYRILLWQGPSGNRHLLVTLQWLSDSSLGCSACLSHFLQWTITWSSFVRVGVDELPLSEKWKQGVQPSLPTTTETVVCNEDISESLEQFRNYGSNFGLSIRDLYDHLDPGF